MTWTPLRTVSYFSGGGRAGWSYFYLRPACRWLFQPVGPRLFIQICSPRILNSRPVRLDLPPFFAEYKQIHRGNYSPSSTDADPLGRPPITDKLAPTDESVSLPCRVLCGRRDVQRRHRAAGPRRLRAAEAHEVLAPLALFSTQPTDRVFLKADAPHPRRGGGGRGSSQPAACCAGGWASSSVYSSSKPHRLLNPPRVSEKFRSSKTSFASPPNIPRAYIFQR